MKNAQILNYIEKVRASYWFIPTVMAIIAIVMSFLTTWIDATVGSEWPGSFSWMHANRPEGARAVLSTIAGSMITVASVTFSMTITSVAYATGQIGPRLISNFMRDRANQVTLGTFIATFLYCLLVLRTIVGAGESSGEQEAAATAFVPHFAILVAIMLAVASVAVLIFFIHHVPESINVSNIISRVGNDLINAIDKMFPASMGVAEADIGDEDHDGLPADFFAKATPIASEVHGYIQVLDVEDLLKIATDNDLLLRLEYRPGNFLTKGDVLLYAHPKERVTNDVKDKCRRCFAFGQQRTPNQDILFLTDELTEIIARALSPGINDPYTALSAMDWLQSALQEMAFRDIPDAKRYDAQHRLRLVVYPLNFYVFIDSIFEKMLPYVARDRNAALRAMKIIGEIAIKTGDARYREAVLRHGRNLKDASAEALGLTVDRNAVEHRFNQLQKALEDESYLLALRDSRNWLGGSA